jgi:hypothetical protein
VLYQQLVAAIEQVGQRTPAHRRVEHIGLVDPHSGQRLALARSLVAEAGQLLFARKQFFALGNPLIPGNDAMVLGAHLENCTSAGYLCLRWADAEEGISDANVGSAVTTS